MSDYDFILDEIRYSHSSVTSYENCPYGFKLGYIDSVSPKESNFFGEYGNLHHKCMEKYFNGELDIFELSDYYNKEYSEIVKHAPPSFPIGMEETYRLQGQEYFNNFSINRDDYNVIFVESTIDFNIDDIKVTARPDLIAFNKLLNKNIMIDYKTSNPFKISKEGKETTDKKKLDGYYRQMFLYTYALRNHVQTPIDLIDLWFVRTGRNVIKEWTKEEEDNSIIWFLNTIDKIKHDENFEPNNKNKYFCQNLCGVKKFCKFY